jgi:NADH:ubiquinone oxidoreductase subunit 3 (subunit A)
MIKILGILASIYSFSFGLVVLFILFDTDMHRQYGWNTSHLSLLGFMAVVAFCVGSMYASVLFQRKGDS